MWNPFLLVATALAVLAADIAVAEQNPACAPDAPRTLAEILERIEAGPRADASRANVAAAEALIDQAGARPNPELVTELEDFTGSGSFSEFGESQTTVSLSQRIELGGVRARRVDVATRESGARRARAAQSRLRDGVTARQQYAEVVAAAEKIAILTDDRELTRDLLADADRRHGAGAASTVDVERARVAAATADLAVADAERDAAVAVRTLVGLWGGSTPDADCLLHAIARDSRPKPALAVPVDVTAIDARLRATDPSQSPSQPLDPAVAIADAEVESRRAEVELARATAAPDLEIGAGLRHLAGPDDVSVVAAMRVELPVFDRNSGAITAAEHKLLAAQSHARAVRIEAGARVARLRQALDAAARRAHTLDTTIIPASRRAYESLTRAWHEGAASSLELFESRRSLVSLRIARVDAALEYHRTLTALEAALGHYGAGNRQSGSAASGLEK